MKRKTSMNQDNAKVCALLDHIIERQHLKNDAALARFLGWTPPTVSKLRNARITGLSGDQKIDIHLKTGMPMVDIIAAVNGVNQE